MEDYDFYAELNGSPIFNELNKLLEMDEAEKVETALGCKVGDETVALRAAAALLNCREALLALIENAQQEAL